MAFCTKCGYNVGDGSKFCPKCGAPQRNNIENSHRSDEKPYNKAVPKVESYQAPIRNNENSNGSSGDYLKPILVGLAIGAAILGAGFSGYYLYDKSSSSAATQSSIANTAGTATSSKSSASEEVNKDKSSSDDAGDTDKKDDGNDSDSLNSSSKDYIFPDSQSVKLTDEKLSLLSKETLGIARNEIYARHGYVFQTEPYKSYFKGKAWYKPNPSFKGTDDEMNAVEVYNVQLILKYENRK